MHGEHLGILIVVFKHVGIDYMSVEGLACQIRSCGRAGLRPHALVHHEPLHRHVAWLIPVLHTAANPIMIQRKNDRAEMHRRPSLREDDG